ncbi:hypothetical protein [Stutzerimonas zhaodongensis]|uniref:hypothetical protein n=1 Tax=Stutzerimonas zhaodongensis TaxID=1176257 RepID=UPI002102EAE5|nr:hypothetical protein [Stutzerimonas zhaodongensis]MCQ2032251.1 hypothetical protein [Stutzerimonas zhaodongensis]
MAKKTLPGTDAPSLVGLANRDDRQSTKRLTFDVTAEEHRAFKSEAIDAGMSMVEYFQHLWKRGK